MLRPVCFFTPALLLFSACTFAQSPSMDSQTLQALLTEVRQLRHDLQANTVAAQRAQILLHRVGIEESLVRRIQERVDANRGELAHTQQQEARLHADLKRVEDSLDRAESPSARKETEDVIAGFKAELERQTAYEQEIQAKLAETEDQFRIEQAKLARLEDDLDRLDKTLESSSAQNSSSPK